MWTGGMYSFYPDRTQQLVYQLCFDTFGELCGISQYITTCIVNIIVSWPMYRDVTPKHSYYHHLSKNIMDYNPSSLPPLVWILSESFNDPFLWNDTSERKRWKKIEVITLMCIPPSLHHCHSSPALVLCTTAKDKMTQRCITSCQVW